MLVPSFDSLTALRRGSAGSAGSASRDEDCVAASLDDSRDGGLTTTDSRAEAWELDRVVAAFEREFARRRASLAELDYAQFAPELRTNASSAALRELARVDLELGMEAGLPRSAEAYRDRFPAVWSDDSAWEELRFEERRLRRECDADSRGAATPLLVATASGAPQHRLPEPGEELCGFEIRHVLGRGAFSRVYLAVETGLARRHVALKISEHLPGEADTLSRLQHKNIVPIYSIHRHGPYHLVCMPFLGANTLADALRNVLDCDEPPRSGRAIFDTLDFQATMTWVEGGVRTPAAVEPEPKEVSSPLATGRPTRLADKLAAMTYTDSVLWLGAELASGLEHAHQRGVLHRDIKPANVLLTDDGLPMLLDFNLATDGAATSPAGPIVGGTLPYMSPEQIESILEPARSVDERSDLYSLGLVLYELLYRRPAYAPPTGVTNEELRRFWTERQAEPACPVDGRLGVSSGVAAILRKAIAPRPADRYQSAKAFKEELRRHLNHEPIREAQGEAWGDRIAKWNRRHPRCSASTIVGIVALLLLATLGAWTAVRHRGLARLEARAWWHQAQRTESAARGFAAQIAPPDGQVDAIFAECDQALDESKISRHVVALGADEAELARALVGRLYFYRARGWCGLAAKAASEAPVRERLGRAAADVAAARRWHPSGLPASDELRSALDETLARAEVSMQSLAIAMQATRTDRGVHAALADALRVVELESTNPWYWLTRGELQKECGDREGARASLQLARELAPETPWPTFHLGVMELEERRWTLAEERFSETLAIDESLAEARFNRALARVGMGRDGEAARDLETIETQVERFPRALLVLESIAARRGDLTTAERYRNRGLELMPTDALAWNARGEAWLRCVPAAPERAWSDFQEAARRAPGFRQAYMNSAHVLSERLGRSDEAQRALDAVLEIDQSYALAWSSRAVLRARRGERDASLQDVERALALDRSPLVCYQAASALALVKETAADERRALDLLRETLRQDAAWCESMTRDPDLAGLSRQDDLRQLLIAAQQLR